MDIDISDILASVTRSVPGDPSSSSVYLDTDTSTDHQLLTRSWISERCAPDLLFYPTELMQRVMTRVQHQINTIEDLASGMGDGYSAQNNKGVNSRQNANLTLSILQTDLSRTQFLIRSFLRQRLAKLTKFAVFYLSSLDTDEKNVYLSAAETAFLKNHQALLSRFYDASFLQAFPAGLRRLDDSSGGVPMVEGPDGATAVVVRCLLPEGWRNGSEVDERKEGGASVELRMSRGEVWVVRWRDVRKGVERGDLELL
ncbi:hypothetical protein LTR84_008256 [Exophiala bonariae]|uniref:DNA replication complex GINS protein SLD5 n=1 Tax=Exophiala bonariae TaxID=1690606 RepID=A0AAV9N1C1_9EURO|nr:hypothetical protein LTR84_008256 [Exophiala bonariae]